MYSAKGMLLFLGFLASHQAYATSAPEENYSGKVESINMLIPDGESLANTRAIWLQSAATKCDFRDFKIIRYSENDRQYEKSETSESLMTEQGSKETPALISGTFQCLQSH